MPVQSPAEKDPEQDSRGKRLESWKEIAGYLNRHVTTIRRWEKHEGLPAHRHRHSKLGSIYAYTRELDVWFESRRDESDDPGAATTGASESSERLLPPPLLAGGAHEAVHLTGREEEINLLRSSWERTARGQQQIAVVTGEPGVGKTRLVVEFARSIARHATVLVGRCDREALVAYAPWVTILQWMIRTIPAHALRQHLAAVEAGSDLAQIVPEISTRIHIGAPGSRPDVDRYRLFEAASQLLAAASQGAPILLVIDDLHWADRGSLLLLRYMIRSTRQAAICIVITHRNEVPEWSSEFRDLLDSLRREHTPTRVALHRLSDDDVRDMIEEWTGRDPPLSLTRLVARHTEGNPLFVVEMLKHLDETGALALRQEWHGPITLADVGLPEGIRHLIGRRLERLGLTTRRLLTIGAVIGREFRLSDIEALVDVGEDAVLDAMDEALTASIVTEEVGAPGNFSFTHTLIREALYTSITAARRVRLHHRIAGALEQQLSPSESRVAELAYHFGQAAVYKSADKAVEYAARAGDHAATALAFENAAHWYDVALRAMDFVTSNTDATTTTKRSELHVKRGRSFFAVGEWAPAKNAFEAAASLLGPAEHEKRAELLVRLAEAAFWLMDVPALRKFAAEAQALADRAGRDDLWADAQAWMASAMVSDGDVLAAIQMDREAIARAGGIRSFGLARTPLTLYWAGLSGEAIQQGVQAVETARAAEDPAFLLYALQHLGLGLSGAGRFDDALRVFDEARTFGRRCGALPLLARATSMSVAPLMSLGDLDGAMARALDARELAHRAAFEPPLVSAGIDLLMIFARQQDPGRAETLLDDTAQAVQNASGWHAWKWNMRLSQARAELALARSAWGEAVQAATSVIDQSRSRRRPKYEALGLVTRARAAHRLGARSAAKDARAAVNAGRRLADPAVLLDCLIVLLEIEGTDALLDEARQTAQSIVRAVSDETLRSTFLTSVRNKAPRVVASGDARK